METDSLSPALNTFMFLSIAETRISRAFNSRLNGLGFTEFIILFHLVQAEGEKLRRSDLSERTGLTPSGITRLLLPMEKIGLVGRGEDERDARVRFVTLTSAGKTKFMEELPYANALAETKFPANGKEKTADILQFLKDIR